MKRKFRCRGSFTVEAAVIAPLAVFLVAALVALTFLSHDRVWFTGAACEAALAANAAKNGQEEALEKIDQKRAERILPGAAPQAEAESGRSGTTVRFSGERDLGYFGSLSPWRAEVSVRRVRPAGSLRELWALKQLGEEVTKWDI